MSTVTAAAWFKGISFSILASIIGASSKLAIRKSWLMQQQQQPEPNTSNNEHERQQHERRIGSTTSLSEYNNSYHAIEENNDEGASAMADDRLGDSEHSQNSESSSFHNEQQQQTTRLSSTTRHNRVDIIAWILRGSGMIGMTFLNPACCVLAMNYASPSILAPFSGLTLVWIVLLSQPLIAETPTGRQVLAASLIIVGEVLVAVFGDHTNQEDMTIDKMTASYKQGPFLTYTVGVSIWMMLLMYWMKYSINAKLKRFAWGVAGGSITGFQNFLKDTLTLLKVKSDHERLPRYTPFLALLAVATAFTGLVFLTACMKRYDATYSAAMFVGSFVVSASLMAAVHYQTFAHLQALVNWILYPVGLLVLMGGVWLLVHDKEAEDAQDRVLIPAASAEEGEEEEEVDSESVVSASTTSTAARVELMPLVHASRA